MCVYFFDYLDNLANYFNDGFNAPIKNFTVKAIVPNSLQSLLDLKKLNRSMAITSIDDSGASRIVAEYEQSEQIWKKSNGRIDDGKIYVHEQLVIDMDSIFQYQTMSHESYPKIYV
ncbi:TPA: hypothetical protein U2I44_002119 [Providencia rettgeri]|nr:hypothetical protein [Providencia rettgeri]